MVNLKSSLDYLHTDLDRLARRTGIEKARVVDLADGAAPSALELRLIADYLKLPANALFRLRRAGFQPDIRYRAAANHKNPTVASARIREIGELFREAGLSTSKARLLNVDASLDDIAVIENAATAVREHICEPNGLLEPLCDLPDRLDQMGVSSSIVLTDLPIDGAVSVFGGKGLIVMADRTFKPRMLFTCAHELAHLVLGHVDEDKWLIDEDTIEDFSVDSNDERLCNVLASAILLPAEAVARFLKIIRTEIEAKHDSISSVEIAYLSRYFGTSFLAAAMRLEILGLLPQGGGLAFEQEIKRDHASAEAYGDSLGLPDRNQISIPRISIGLRQKLRAALTNGTISIGRASETLGYSTIEMSNALT